MRILRGKSNLEVSSRGFALFVVGLVLATFMGGAVRTMLSSNDVHRRIVAQLKTLLPNHTFNIERTQVLLSRGAWPGLGVRLYGVTLNQEVCGKLSFELDVPQATLPLNLWSLMRGKPRLGDVQIPKGTMHLDYHPCEPPAPSTVAGATATTTAASIGEITVDPSKSINLPKVRPDELRRFVSSFRLNDFAVTYEKNPSWRLVFNSVELDADQETSLHAMVDVQKILETGTLSHAVELETHTDGEVVKWEVNTVFKEGHLNVHGAIDQSSQAANANLVLKQVPLKDFLSEAHQAGFVRQELKLKAAWLSCAAEWEGSITAPAATPVAVHDCKIEGGYGRADLDKIELWLNSKDPLRAPALIKVRQLQIQPLLEALDREVLPAVLSKLGHWTGSLEFLNQKSWKLDGHLENAEIVFSNQSVRGKQGIEKLHTQVQILNGEVHGRIDEMSIHNGEFLGVLDFALDENWRNGRFKARVERLALSPPIQRLMVGGTVSSASLHGDGKLADGELSDWDGTIKLSEISGHGWRSTGVNVKSSYRPGAVHLETTVKTASVTPTWRHYGNLKPLLADLTGEVTWKDLSAKVDMIKTGGEVQTVSATLEPDQQPWTGRGRWVRDGEMTATLKLGRTKSQQFNLRGEKGVLTVALKSGS